MAADRAYIAGGRVGDANARLMALSDRLMALFAAAGAQRVDPAALHPADALLDVYGEDLRARAFLVEQPGAAPLFLRPDFTVPVLQLHLKARAEPARYCYRGPVWRRQPPGAGRPSEYLQAGVEIYGEDAAGADATVFALMRDALAAGGVAAPQVVTGDLGVAIAMLEAAPLPPLRRAALRRHFWRPARFQALLRRYAAAAPDASPARAALLAAAGDSDAVAALAAAAGADVGARDLDDVAARAAALAEDAAHPPADPDTLSALERALAVEAPAPAALAALTAIAAEARLDATAALDRFARRLEALAARGVDVDALPFRAATARSLEYYDGFVFEMYAPDRPDLPPLAAGGRYDGIAAALGAPPAPAVGAMVRPEALLAAGAAPC